MPRNRSEKDHVVLKHKVWMPTDSRLSGSRWIDRGGSWAFLVQHPTAWEYKFSIWLQCDKGNASEFSIRHRDQLHEAMVLWDLLDTRPLFFNLPHKNRLRRAGTHRPDDWDWISSRDGPWPIIGPGLWDGEHFPNGTKGRDQQ